LHEGQEADESLQHRLVHAVLHAAGVAVGRLPVNADYPVEEAPGQAVAGRQPGTGLWVPGLGYGRESDSRRLASLFCAKRRAVGLRWASFLMCRVTVRPARSRWGGRGRVVLAAAGAWREIPMAGAQKRGLT